MERLGRSGTPVSGLRSSAGRLSFSRDAAPAAWSASSKRVRIVFGSWACVDAVAACDSAWVAAGVAHRVVEAEGNGW